MGQQPAPWSIISDVAHASCGPFSIRRRSCRRESDQAEGTFYTIEVADWVCVIALTKEDKLLLVRQFRFGVNDFTWELPAGLIDPGESIEEAARRELEEETGYIGRIGETIAVLHPNPALQANRCHFVIIHQAEPGGTKGGDFYEETEVLELDRSAYRDWVYTGKVSHALAVAALPFLDKAIPENRES